MCVSVGVCVSVCVCDKYSMLAIVGENIGENVTFMRWQHREIRKTLTCESFQLHSIHTRLLHTLRPLILHRRDTQPPPAFSSTASSSVSGETTTTNDHLLAMMLQLEYDKEHDTILKAEEKAYNKDSKGVYIQYMHVHLWNLCNLDTSGTEESVIVSEVSYIFRG